MQEIKQKIQAMADRCRDLGKTNRKDEKEYEEKMKTAEWAMAAMLASRSRASVYEMIADELQELLDDWKEEADDGK